MPSAINAETWVCRNAWNVTRGSPKAVTVRLQSFVSPRGDRGDVLSGVGNTSASATILPRPSAKRGVVRLTNHDLADPRSVRTLTLQADATRPERQNGSV